MHDAETLLFALAGGVGIATVVAVVGVLGGPRRRPPPPVAVSAGRVRLPVRALERTAITGAAVSLAMLMGVSAQATHLVALWLALFAVVVAAWRGSFEAPQVVEANSTFGPDEQDDDGYVDHADG